MQNNKIEALIETVKILRGPNGCPWDKEQTMKSLKPCLLEEAYEVLEVMEEGGKKLKEELGDLLLQICMQSEIQSEAGNFDIYGVADSINEKLVRRHPHVFGETVVENSEEVMKNWEEIKKDEESHKDRESAIDGIPITLPAMQKAYKIQKKAAKVGFDWEDADGAMLKLEEEIEEVREAVKEKDLSHIEEEIGDMIFAVINIARKLKVDPEEALNSTIKKFDKRFRYIEKNTDISKADLEEMEKLWQEAKNET